jgi:glutamyl-tRNA synthetase
VFSVAQFCEWFDLDHITPSAAQFNTEKLNWLNSHYLKLAEDSRLVALVKPRLQARGINVTAAPSLEAIVALYKGRVATLNELADTAEVFYIDLHPEQSLLDTHLTTDVLPAMHEMMQGLAEITWEAASIAALIKELITKHGLKMPKLAMPLRVMLAGQTQTPSVDALVCIFPREMVLARLARYLQK